MGKTEEAIEYFAGHLPPVWARDEAGCLIDPAGVARISYLRSHAWATFRDATTITRRAWAESQCIAKVREVLGIVDGDPAKNPPQLSIHLCCGVAIEFISGNEHKVWRGPDLLTAALTACRAMEATNED